MVGGRHEPVAWPRAPLAAVCCRRCRWLRQRLTAIVSKLRRVRGRLARRSVAACRPARWRHRARAHSHGHTDNASRATAQPRPLLAAATLRASREPALLGLVSRAAATPTDARAGQWRGVPPAPRPALVRQSLGPRAQSPQSRTREPPCTPLRNSSGQTSRRAGCQPQPHSGAQRRVKGSGATQQRSCPAPCRRPCG